MDLGNSSLTSHRELLGEPYPVAVSQLMDYYVRYYPLRPARSRAVRGRREGRFLRVICDTSPLLWEHIHLVGPYRFDVPVMPESLRPLRAPVDDRKELELEL